MIKGLFTSGRTGSFLCCRFDGFFNAQVRTTPADVAAHVGIDVGIGRLGILFQQGCRRHNLPGLAVTTLRYVVLQPSLLNGVIALDRQTFDGGNGLLADGRNGQLAGRHGNAVQMHLTGSALGDATAVLGAGQVQMVA